VHKNKTKQDDNARQLVIVFSGCIEIKPKKIMTSVGWSLSSWVAQKQNKKT